MLRQSFNVSWQARCRLLASVTRSYSDYAYVEPDAEELQQRLLDAALKHVKQHGWSQASISAAASDLRLSPAVSGMFSRGPSELVEHVIKKHNQQLAQELQSNQQEFLKLPVRQRIAVAVRKRLEMNVNYMDSWPQALAILAQPTNSPTAAKLLFELLDDIWYAAGDSSTDVNWYTKRALLAAVYTSTELYMLTDFSPGYQDTWEQLDRRIADILWIGAAVRNATSVPRHSFNAMLQLFTGSGYDKYGSGDNSSSAGSKAATHDSATQLNLRATATGMEASRVGTAASSSSSSSRSAVGFSQSAGWADAAAGDSSSAAAAAAGVTAALQQRGSALQLKLSTTPTGMIVSSSSSSSSSNSS